ncbi:hypothetical protein AVEN_118183-1 [Araneus ventricosus]|uniref:Uncharacterized protein n=1 Tax=Araneus ventricosus TaxID=182803 RepID=A0A4Y2JXZ1_ARAVE|nr:hypothetical protein AVEN_118183-1 [Araneus ventricosus]
MRYWKPLQRTPGGKRDGYMCSSRVPTIFYPPHQGGMCHYMYDSGDAMASHTETECYEHIRSVRLMRHFEAEATHAHGLRPDS